MSSRRGQDSGGGCLGWLIGGAIVIAVVVYSVSGVGHLLGLTPTGDEVLDSEDGWVAAHYEGVVIGYILTVLVMAFVVGAILLWRWTQENRPEDQGRVWQIYGGLGAFLAALVLALPVGARETPGPLPQQGPAGDEGGPSASQLAAQERRQDRRREARREAREQREESRARARQRARQVANAEPSPQEESAPPPAESSCDPNYSGACLDPNAPDYDCQGGEGDGPKYTGPVTVVGDDHYGLDTGDGDPAACEPY